LRSELLLLSILPREFSERMWLLAIGLIGAALAALGRWLDER
jgi:hypothetical protein